MQFLLAMFFLCFSLSCGSVCFSKTGPDGIPEANECAGPCVSCELMLAGDKELLVAQGCGTGVIKLRDVTPRSLISLFNPTDDDFVVDVCKRMGYEQVTELVCTEDMKRVLAAFLPERFHSLIGSLLTLIDYGNACCCPSHLCNSVPVQLPQPRIECYQSSKKSVSEPNSVSSVCPGTTCGTCEIVTEIGALSTQESAQGCGAGPFRFSDFIPSEASRALGFDADPVFGSDTCANLGLADVQQLTCIDNPETLLRAGPDEIQPFVSQSLSLIKSFRVCCCGSSLCNTLPTPLLPVPTSPPGNECFYNIKSIPSLADTGSRHCPGPCMSCQIITNDPVRLQEFSSQGCGSGVISLANIVPPQALLYETVVDETVVDPCARLQFKGQGVVCQDSPKDILKALLPLQVLRKANLADFLSRIARMRVCCCVGDHCNGPLKPLL